jgi:hypothetical protein
VGLQADILVSYLQFLTLYSCGLVLSLYHDRDLLLDIPIVNK